MCVFTIIVLGLAAHFLNVLESSDLSEYLLVVYQRVSRLMHGLPPSELCSSGDLHGNGDIVHNVSVVSTLSYDY